MGTGIEIMPSSASQSSRSQRCPDQAARQGGRFATLVALTASLSLIGNTSNDTSTDTNNDSNDANTDNKHNSDNSNCTMSNHDPGVK